MNAPVPAATLGRLAVSRPRRSTSHRPPLLEREGTLGYLLMSPALVVLAVLIAYPFALGIWYSLSDLRVLGTGNFVGLANYQQLLQTPVFRQTVINSFIYTGLATAFKLVLGMGMALVMNQRFHLQRYARAGMLLPYIVPTALSTLAFLLIFNATLTPLPWLLRPFGLSLPASGLLGDTAWAMVCVIFVNVWRGMPFFGITLLAGLQSISPDYYEAATIDGANAWQRFRRITLPLLLPVLTLVLLFSVIQTFSDFQIVEVLTRGGPADSTHLFATLAFQDGLQAGRLGLGAAVSLFMMPFLALLVFVQAWYTRREAH